MNNVVVIPKSVQCRIDEINKITSRLDSTIKLVNRTDISRFEHVLQSIPKNNGWYSKWASIYASSLYKHTSHLSKILSSYESILSNRDSIVSSKFISSSSFKDRIVRLREEYYRSGNRKILSQIRQIQVEWKAALLKNLRKKLKRFNSKKKQLIKLIISCEKIRDLRQVYRQLFHFLFKNLVDEEHLMLCNDQTINSLCNIKIIVNENFFTKRYIK